MCASHNECNEHVAKYMREPNKKNAKKTIIKKKVQKFHLLSSEQKNKEEKCRMKEM